MVAPADGSAAPPLGTEVVVVDAALVSWVVLLLPLLGPRVVVVAVVVVVDDNDGKPRGTNAVEHCDSESVAMRNKGRRLQRIIIIIMMMMMMMMMMKWIVC
jgi:hypothetical protein